jgi:hypothetical protein
MKTTSRDGSAGEGAAPQAAPVTLRKRSKDRRRERIPVYKTTFFPLVTADNEPTPNDRKPS